LAYDNGGKNRCRRAGDDSQGRDAAQHNRLTEADADRLADDITAEWWAANKDRFIPPSAQ